MTATTPNELRAIAGRARTVLGHQRNASQFVDVGTLPAWYFVLDEAAQGLEAAADRIDAVTELVRTVGIADA